MIKLNKIVNLMVIAGVVHFSTAAFAADIQVSQNSQFANQTKVSQQTDTEQAIANTQAGSDSSVQSDSDAQANADSNAQPQQTGSAADESAETTDTQSGRLNGDLVANSTQSLSGSVTQSTSVITANGLSTVSKLQAPTMPETGSSEPMDDSVAMEELAADESAETTNTQSGVLNGDLVANSTQSLSGSVTQSTSVITANGLSTVSKLQAPTMPETRSSEPMDDSVAMEELAADESAETTNTQSGLLNGDLVANSTQSLSSSVAQSTSVIAANNLSTVSQLQVPTMPDTGSPEPMDDPDAVEEPMPNDMPDAPELSNAVSLDNTTDFANNLSANVEQLVSLDVASQATQVIAQSVSTTIADSISSNAQSTVLQTMNSQIDTLVAEQINTEIASATASEVVSTINSDLDLGI